MSIKVKIPNASDNDIRFDGKRDMMQVFDPYKKQWLDWKRTGAVILPSVITVTTGTLDGEPVTCQINDESYTTQFISGVAVFKVYSLGTATITCGTYSTTVNVEADSGEYSAELESDIVLWDGTNLLNGATELSKYIDYSFSAGEMDNAVICVTMAYTYNYNSIRITCDNNSIVTTITQNPNGTITSSTQSNKYTQGSTYTCSVSDVIAYLGSAYKNSIKRFAIGFTNTDGTALGKEVFSKVWIEK